MYQNSDYQIGICCSCTNFKVDLNKCTHTHTKSVTFNMKKFYFFPFLIISEIIGEGVEKEPNEYSVEDIQQKNKKFESTI